MMRMEVLLEYSHYQGLGLAATRRRQLSSKAPPPAPHVSRYFDVHVSWVRVMSFLSLESSGSNSAGVLLPDASRIAWLWQIADTMHRTCETPQTQSQAQNPCALNCIKVYDNKTEIVNCIPSCTSGPGTNCSPAQDRHDLSPSTRFCPEPCR